MASPHSNNPRFHQDTHHARQGSDASFLSSVAGSVSYHFGAGLPHFSPNAGNSGVSLAFRPSPARSVLSQNSFPLQHSGNAPSGGAVPPAPAVPFHRPQNLGHQVTAVSNPGVAATVRNVANAPRLNLPTTDDPAYKAAKEAAKEKADARDAAMYAFSVAASYDGFKQDGEQVEEILERQQVFFESCLGLSPARREWAKEKFAEEICIEYEELGRLADAKSVAVSPDEMLVSAQQNAYRSLIIQLEANKNKFRDDSSLHGVVLAKGKEFEEEFKAALKETRAKDREICSLRTTVANFERKILRYSENLATTKGSLAEAELVQRRNIHLMLEKQIGMVVAKDILAPVVGEVNDPESEKFGYAKHVPDLQKQLEIVKSSLGIRGGLDTIDEMEGTEVAAHLNTLDFMGYGETETFKSFAVNGTSDMTADEWIAHNNGSTKFRKSRARGERKPQPQNHLKIYLGGTPKRTEPNQPAEASKTSNEESKEITLFRVQVSQAQAEVDEAQAILNDAETDVESEVAKVRLDQAQRTLAQFKDLLAKELSTQMRTSP